MKSVDDRTKNVLDLVNTARQILRMPPLVDLPRGTHDSLRCPIAIALGTQVTGSHVVFYFSQVDAGTTDLIRATWGTEDSECHCGWCEVLPSAIAEWIHDFDKGFLPEYEEDPAEYARRADEEESHRLVS